MTRKSRDREDAEQPDGADAGEIKCLKLIVGSAPLIRSVMRHRPTVTAWDELAVGHRTCPMDYPRPESNEFIHFVRKLTASSLYLERNQTYQGHCVLIYDLGHATRVDQLTAGQWAAMAGDIRKAETAIYKAFQPDHINVESLGNVMPHLHWHIIPRYKDDGRWGAPIWTTTLAEMPRKELEEHEYPALASRINDAMEDAA